MANENWHASLLHLFPDYKEGDWELSADHERKVTISKWNRPEPQPPADRLNAVTPSQRNAANANARFKREFEASKKDKALITWIAAKHGLSYQDALDEIQLIRDGL